MPKVSVSDTFNTQQGETLETSFERASQLQENGKLDIHDGLQEQDQVTGDVLQTFPARPGDVLEVEEARAQELEQQGVGMIMRSSVGESDMGEPERAVDESRETATSDAQESGGGIEEAAESESSEDSEDDSDDSESDLPDEVTPRGSGWFEMPDGEKIQGREQTIQLYKEEY